MRKIHAVSTLLLVLAGVAGAAESAALKEFGAGLGERISAAANAEHVVALAVARKEAAAAGITGTGSPVANSYRDAAIEQAVAARRAAQAAFDKQPLMASEQAARFLGAAMAGTANEAVAMSQATRPLFVAEMAATLAKDWQGSSALCAIDWGSVNLPVVAIGIGAERLAIDDEPVVGAVEAVVRIGLPIPVGGLDGRLSIGPAFAGRAGVTFDGDLVIGLDLFAHAEYAVAPGIGIVADLGAGQRATEHAASDIQPVGSVGLAFIF